MGPHRPPRRPADPARVLAVGVTVLVLLALALPTMQLSFDERAAQPPDTPSNLGLAAMAEHFPPNQTLPDYLLIRSDHDMANTRDLAVLNAVSTAVAKVDGVDQVRSITQPAGKRLEPASIADQLGKLAKGLNTRPTASWSPGSPGWSGSPPGPATSATRLGQVSAGAGKAQDGAGQAQRRQPPHRRRPRQGRRRAPAQAADGARQLRDGAAELAAGLRTAHDQVAQAVDGLGMIVEALERRPDLHRRPDLQDDPARACARSTPANATSSSPAWPKRPPARNDRRRRRQARDGLDQLASRAPAGTSRGSDRIADGQALLSSKLGELEGGTDRLATGAAGIAPGIEQLLTQTEKLRNGLDDSGDYLQDVNQARRHPRGRRLLPARLRPRASPTSPWPAPSSSPRTASWPASRSPATPTPSPPPARSATTRSRTPPSRP